MTEREPSEADVDDILYNGEEILKVRGVSTRVRDFGRRKYQLGDGPTQLRLRRELVERENASTQLCGSMLAKASSQSETS